MKFMRYVGLCMIAIMAACGIAASSAAAALPAFLITDYVCDQSATAPPNQIGQFITVSKCIDPTQANEMAGMYWRLPARFTGESTEPSLHSGGVLKLSVKCKSATDVAEVEGEQTVGRALFDFKECKSELGGACTTAGSASGLIITKELDGTLGLVSKPLSGLALKPEESGAVASFTCESLGTVSIEGCLIGEVLPLNTMSEHGESIFAENSEKSGAKWTKLEGGSECVLTVKDGETSVKGWVTAVAKETYSTLLGVET